MFEVIVQVRLRVAARDEHDAAKLVAGELTSWLEPTNAPDWVQDAVVEMRAVRRTEEVSVLQASLWA